MIVHRPFPCSSCPYLCTSHMGPDILSLASAAVRLPVSGFEPADGLQAANRQKRLQEAVPAALRSAGRSASIAARMLSSRRPASMLMIHPKTGEVFANVRARGGVFVRTDFCPNRLVERTLASHKRQPSLRTLSAAAQPCAERNVWLRAA